MSTTTEPNIPQLADTATAAILEALTRQAKGGVNSIQMLEVLATALHAVAALRQTLRP